MVFLLLLMVDAEGWTDSSRASRESWRRATDCDTAMFAETTIERPSVDSGRELDIHAELRNVLAEQRAFHPVRQRDLPHIACRIQIWRHSR